MFDQSLGRSADARRYAEQLLAEGYAKGYPIAVSVAAIRLYLKERGLPLPGDTLAFVSGGKIHDAQVRDWLQPS